MPLVTQKGRRRGRGRDEKAGRGMNGPFMCTEKEEEREKGGAGPRRGRVL